MKNHLHSRFAVLFVVLLVGTTKIFAQIPYWYGTPITLEQKFPDLKLKPVSLKQFNLPSALTPVNPKDEQYGVAVPYNALLSRPDKFEKIGEDIIWFAKVTSDNAQTLDLLFSDVKLAPKARLFIYDGNKNTVMGPITATNSK